MKKNTNLHRAKKAKNDEFYTQYKDIENELQHYTEHFEGKIVYCNCDNYRWSNFVKYFQDNFKKLKLKKLLASCYPDGIYYQYDGVQEFIWEYPDGSFQSQESGYYLEQADIVCTNPPFSLFREYIAQLFQYQKKFLIIGNMNAVTYKEVFPYIKDNKLWKGITSPVVFQMPDNYPLVGSSFEENGKKYAKLPSIWWFTNLPHKKRNEPIILTEKYDPERYPKYDNYDAINVDKTLDIPMDYDGVMGVPISFLDKYCPEQFEMLGIMNTGEENIGLRYPNTPHGRPIVDGKEIYLRILIKYRANLGSPLINVQ